MVAVAVVALVCGVISRLARMELFFMLAAAFGLYLIAVVACGHVIQSVAPLLPCAERPRDDPSAGQHAGAKPRL
jgi:hypothetical protein